jgi:hypothetical protein
MDWGGMMDGGMMDLKSRDVAGGSRYGEMQ